MRTGTFFAPLTLIALAGCQLFGGGNKPTPPTPTVAATPARAGVIAIEPSSASIKFTGSTAIMSQEGHFESFQGSLEMPTKDPKDASIRVKVDMASTTTKIGLLTKHLKGEDFFDVEKYPTAEFISERIAATSEPGRYQVTGRFTIHGVSQPVAFPARIVVKGEDVTFDATILLSQTAFGMTEAARKTKDEVPVTVTIHGLRK